MAKTFLRPYHICMTDIRQIDPEPSTPLRQGGLSRVSLAVMIIAGLAALGSVFASLYFFTGFAENDLQPGALLSAFMLCFGVGALGYVPMIWITLIARRVRRNGASRADIAIVFALVIPWVVLSIVLLATGWPLAVYGAILAALSVFILTWAWALVREHPAPSQPREKE